MREFLKSNLSQLLTSLASLVVMLCVLFFGWEDLTYLGPMYVAVAIVFTVVPAALPFHWWLRYRRLKAAGGSDSEPTLPGSEDSSGSRGVSRLDVDATQVGAGSLTPVAPWRLKVWWMLVPLLSLLLPVMIFTPVFSGKGIAFLATLVLATLVFLLSPASRDADASFIEQQGQAIAGLVLLAWGLAGPSILMGLDTVLNYGGTMGVIFTIASFLSMLLLVLTPILRWRQYQALSEALSS